MTTTDNLPVIFDRNGREFTSFDLPELSYAETMAALVAARAQVLERMALVEQPTGPIELPPDPDEKPKLTVAGVIALAAGTIAISGLVFTAMRYPGTDLVFWAIGIALAVSVASAFVLLRTAPVVAPDMASDRP